MISNATTALKPRSLILDGVTFDMLWIKPTVTSGVTVTDSAGKMTVPTLTLTGTDPSTCLSLNPYAIEQPAALNNDARLHVTNADLGALDAFTDLSTLTGGFLVAFDYYRAADTVTTSTIIQRGQHTTNSWYILDQVNNPLRFMLVPTDFSSGLQSSALTDAAWNHAAFYLDAASSTSLLFGTPYTNGVSGSAVSVAKSAVTAPTATHGLTFMARELATAGSFSMYTAAGNRLRNIIMMRFNGDQNAHIADIVDGLYRDPFNLPWAVENINE